MSAEETSQEDIQRLRAALRGMQVRCAEWCESDAGFDAATDLLCSLRNELERLADRPSGVTE